jgi:hypothetical protein
MEAQGVIIARLQGGLGNQLFQYAAGRRLAGRREQELGLDIRDLRRTAKGNTPRPYLLDRLNIRATVLPAAALLLRGHFPGRLGRVTGWRRVRETGGYLPLPEGRGGAYLDGYWQSWRYLQGQRPALLRDLVPLKPAAGRNALLLKQMAAENAVCVHVRRGDYASQPGAQAYHGLIGPAYYKAAAKRLGKAVYYVFSDEPAWARRHLPLPGRRVIVDHNGVDAPEEDLRLMAACRHFIIANSSLSWWGAWLGVQKGKKVVAPAQWFKAGPPTPELCPPAWIRL